MVYTNSRRSIKPRTRLWACAYSFDNNKTTMGLIQRPILGEVRGYGWNWNNTTEESGYSSFFVPYKKKSESEFAESKSVQIESRVYADTYEECVELFNRLVKERVDWFKERAEETEKDLIIEVE